MRCELSSHNPCSVPRPHVTIHALCFPLPFALHAVSPHRLPPGVTQSQRQHTATATATAIDTETGAGPIVQPAGLRSCHTSSMKCPPLRYISCHNRCRVLASATSPSSHRVHPRGTIAHDPSLPPCYIPVPQSHSVLPLPGHTCSVLHCVTSQVAIHAGLSHRAPCSMPGDAVRWEDHLHGV
jgi:hypothetical protein